jgi:preprotein translocase subunit SecE
MGIARYVNLSFVAIGLILYIILSGLFSALIELFGSSANAQVLGSNFRIGHLIALVVSVAVAVQLRRSDKVHTWALEVGNELSKVTWPTWKETKKATWVVIITTLIIAAILGLLDWVFGNVSRIFYS